MDITPLFKACVKTVRLQNKAIPLQDKNRILKKSTKDEFSKKTKDIKFQISQLRNFLIENRAAYMQFACHLKRSAQVRMWGRWRNFFELQPRFAILVDERGARHHRQGVGEDHQHLHAVHL